MTVIKPTHNSGLSRSFTADKLLRALDGQPILTGPVPGPSAGDDSTLLHHTIDTQTEIQTTDQKETPAEPNAEQTKENAPLELYTYKSYDPAPVLAYTRDEDEANDFVQMLRPGPLGFDMEWRVILRRGQKPQEFKTAVIQLCDEYMILVIQISAMKNFPKYLKAKIEDKDTIKLGANILNDGRKLCKDYGVFANNLVELGKLAQQADSTCSFQRQVVSLAKVTEKYCGKHLSKGKERMGNWEAVLPMNMREYAANDAHCALMAYNNLIALADEVGVTLNPAEYTSHVAPPPSTVPADTPQTASTTAQASASSTTPSATSSTVIQIGPHIRPQYTRALQFWRGGMDLDTMARN